MHLNTRRDSDILVVARLITASPTTLISAVTVPTTTTSAAAATKVNHQLPKKMLGGDYSNGPCNGVFCLYDSHEILLWNPAINDLKVVPPSNEPCRVPPNPMKAFSAELGFDPKTNDFKILHVWYDFSHRQHQLQLYALGTNSWKNLDIAAASTFNTCKLHFSSPRFNTNSKIGWVAFDSDLPQYKLCLFDVSRETFDMTPPIPTEDAGSILPRETRVFPFRGSIAVVLVRLPDFFGSFEIWSWNDLTCTTSWTKLSTISHLQHPFQRPLGL